MAVPFHKSVSPMPSTSSAVGDRTNSRSVEATLRMAQTIIQPLVAFQQAIDTVRHFFASLTNKLSSIG